MCLKLRIGRFKFLDVCGGSVSPWLGWVWESWFWMFGCFWEYVIYHNYVIKHILEWEYIIFTYVDVFWESCLCWFF